MNKKTNTEVIPPEKPDKQYLKRLKYPFLSYEMGFWQKIWSLVTGSQVIRLVDGEMLKDQEPFLLYTDENLRTKIYANAKVGIVEPKSKQGKKKGYYNEIVSRKKCILEYDGCDIEFYNVYEREYFPYPIEPRIDTKNIGSIVRNIQANYKEMDEKRELLRGMTMSSVKIWLTAFAGFLGIILATLWIGKTFGVWDMFFTAVEAAKEPAINATANATGVTQVP